ncbi:MAG: acyl-CoA dehydratase activase [Planctomycetota bacterium]
MHASRVGGLCAGIDAGSRTIKAVVLDTASHAVLAAGVVDQGVEQNVLAQQLLDRLLAEIGQSREALRALVATGYGRKLIAGADATITEITCQARGVHHVAPESRTIIDIGGQDSKLLRLTDGGAVADFVMNDRCAAGTGRFLEVVATRLGVRLAELGERAAASRHSALISSMCVVFAETEIVGLLAAGVPVEDIAAGVQAAVATRLVAMGGGDLPEPVVFTGGVALVPGMADALAQALGRPISVAPQPQMTAALGAALLAAKRVNGKS